MPPRRLSLDAIRAELAWDSRNAHLGESRAGGTRTGVGAGMYCVTTQRQRAVNIIWCVSKDAGSDQATRQAVFTSGRETDDERNLRAAIARV